MSSPSRRSPAVSTFMLECYWPGIDERSLAEATTRAQARGKGARLRGAWLVAADEVAYVLLDGTQAAVRRAGRLAGLPFERIVEITELPPPTTSRPET